MEGGFLRLWDGGPAPRGHLLAGPQDIDPDDTIVPNAPLPFGIGRGARWALSFAKWF